MKARMPKYMWRSVCCQRCGLTGLTLVKQSDNIYVHASEEMCAVAKIMEEAHARRIAKVRRAS